MNLSPVKSWSTGETLTASDLNAEYLNIYNHTITTSDMNQGTDYVFGGVVVGSGITSPDGELHVHTASAGSVAASGDADELVLENSSTTGLTIFSGTSGAGNLFFGDSGDNDIGKISYSHSTNALTITTNATTALTLSSAQAATFASTIASGAITATNTTAPLILKYDAEEYVTHAVSSAGVYSITTTDASSDSGAITLDTVDSITLDSDTASEGIVYADGGTNLLRISNSSSDVILKPLVDAKDIVFQQYDGNEVARIADNRRLYLYDEGGEYISSDGSNLTIASGSAAWVLPSSDGSADQVLKTDGSGTLSWTSVASGTIGGSLGSTDNAVPRANGTGGATLQASSVLIDDSNNITGVVNLTASGELDGATLDISGNADIDGTTNLDAVDIDGAVQIDATVTVGVDDQGYDFQLFGDTASAYLLWDTSADKLLTAGGAVIDIVKDKLLIGGTAVTTTAAELNVLDAVTAGTVTGSLGVVVDSNKDIGSFRNITLTGELDAGSLDVSGDADIDGTLEADAITLGGTALGSLYSPIAGSSSIVTVGTVGTGTWQGTAIASAYLDSDTAHLSGTQTFSGNKTFTGTVTTGANSSGVDVKLFGTSSGAYLEWDTSEDQLRIMGASADATTSTGKLLLATSLTDINANDELGKIEFQAPHEAGGTDAIAIAASIKAIAQSTFSASSNATDLIFYTGHSEAATEKFRITSQGELGVGGANYGSDGQVLTSGGAGAAPAWEDAASGGISWSGSNSNAIAYYKDADEAYNSSSFTFTNETDVLLTSSTSAKPVFTIQNTNADATSGELKFDKDSASSAADDVIGLISFYGSDADENSQELFAKIEGYQHVATAGSEEGGIRFSVMSDDGEMQEALTIKGGGNEDIVNIVQEAGVGGSLVIGGFDDDIPNDWTSSISASWRILQARGAGVSGRDSSNENIYMTGNVYNYGKYINDGEGVGQRHVNGAWYFDTFATNSSGEGATASNTNTAILASNGNFTITGVYASSDERLKTEIETIPGAKALETVKALEGKTFKKLGNPEFGFVAQEVQEVDIAKTSVQSRELTGGNYLDVNYSMFAGLHNEAIKELIKQVETLQDEVNALKAG